MGWSAGWVGCAGKGVLNVHRMKKRSCYARGRCMGYPVIRRWFPSHSHSRLSPLASAGSCVVRVCRGESCCLRCSGAGPSIFPLLSWSCLLCLGLVVRGWCVLSLSGLGFLVFFRGGWWILVGLWWHLLRCVVSYPLFGVLCCCLCSGARVHGWLGVGSPLGWRAVPPLG